MDLAMYSGVGDEVFVRPLRFAKACSMTPMVALLLRRGLALSSSKAYNRRA